MKIASIVILLLCMLTAQSVPSTASPAATGSFTERDANEEFGDNFLDKDDVKVANSELEMRRMGCDSCCRNPWQTCGFEGEWKKECCQEWNEEKRRWQMGKFKDGEKRECRRVSDEHPFMECKEV